MIAFLTAVITVENYLRFDEIQLNLPEWIEVMKWNRRVSPDSATAETVVMPSATQQPDMLSGSSSFTPWSAPPEDGVRPDLLSNGEY